MVLIMDLSCLSFGYKRQLNYAELFSFFSCGNIGCAALYLTDGDAKKSTHRLLSFAMENDALFACCITSFESRTTAVNPFPKDLRKEIRRAIPLYFHGSKYKSTSYI